MSYGDLKIWNLCSSYSLRKNIFGNFFVSIGRVKSFTWTEQIFIDFHYYNDQEWFFENIKKFTFLLKVKFLRRWYFFDNLLSLKGFDLEIHGDFKGGSSSFFMVDEIGQKIPCRYDGGLLHEALVQKWQFVKRKLAFWIKNPNVFYYFYQKIIYKQLLQQKLIEW